MIAKASGPAELPRWPIVNRGAPAASERSPGPVDDPAVEQFRALVGRIARRDRCDSVSAMGRARSEDPSLFERYRSAGAPGAASRGP